jgi:hypothetical protein
VTAAHAVLCWGLNDAGQLGRGFVTANQSLFPAVAITGLNASKVSVGYNHACAVALNGSVQCWGSDEYGQLGNGQSNTKSNFPFASPQPVTGITNATMVSAGFEFTCAALADISVKCWGYNEFGKVGKPTSLGTIHPQVQPIDVATPSSVDLGPGGKLNYVTVTAGHDHACASGTFGGGLSHSPLGLVVKCWGSNADLQITNTSTKTPWKPRAMD